MVSVVAANLMQPTRYTTQWPIWRLHLAHILLAALITLFSITATWPLYTSMIVSEIVGNLALALCSRLSWPRAPLDGMITWASTLMMTDVPISPGIVPQLCTAVLVAYDLPRMPAYGLVVLSLVLSIVDAQWGETSKGWISLLAWWVVAGGGAATLAELIRSPRDRTERSLRTYRESVERRRLLVVTELHDIVVRDLAHAVMTVEQARLAHPQGVTLAPQLDAMAAAVRMAVEQIRHALHAVSDIHGGGWLNTEATSTPHPLEAMIADATAVLGQQGTRLEVEGLELLGIPVIPPDVRLQLLRVLGGLVSNMFRCTTPQGWAKLVVESDGRSLEAMVSNDIDLLGRVGGAQADVGAPDSGVPGYDAFFSSLGLEGTRRRVEVLGGSLSVSQDEDHWATVFGIPFQAVS